MRTTLDIDGPILEEIKRLREQDGRSLGRVVSDLLAWALSSKKEQQAEPTEFHWTARAMGARIDIADKEALYRALDESTDQ